MNLSQPITINVNNKNVTFNDLKLVIIDNNHKKNVKVYIHPCRKLLTLWENEAYDDIGDYTQAQVETKVTELLGSDPGSKLLELYNA